ncbi:MAG: LCP family protein [Kineosporiaceae bacterium]
MEDLFRPANQPVDETVIDDIVVISAPPPPPRASRRGKVLLAVASGLIGAMVLVTLSGYLYVRHVEGVVAASVRTAANPFQALDQQARPAPSGRAVNLLVLAADTELDLTDTGAWEGDAQRLDTVLLVHIGATRKTVDVVTLPRQTEAPVSGYGRRTLADALRLGGPSLLIGSVESLTDLRVDHLVAVDFAGFTKLTDALGGVDVTVPSGTPAEGTSYPPGTRHMSGSTALDYIREGDGDRPGDAMIRAKRQQSWLRAIGNQALSKGLLTRPDKVGDILGAAASSLTVDATLTTQRMRSLAISLRSVRSSDIRYVTAPGSAGRSDGARYVLDERAARLWAGLKADDHDGVAAALR